MSWMDLLRAPEMPDASSALPGRDEAMLVPPAHAVLSTSMQPPYPANCEQALFGMGCFWGIERLFWQWTGFTTAVGWRGIDSNPTYRGLHGWATTSVQGLDSCHDYVAADCLWENHDPTQGMRQGNDRGTQYRSGIYYFSEAQKAAAESSLAAFQPRLSAAGYGDITTEILPAPTFYFAEEYHQQYLHKNPAGYCGMGGTGVACAIGTGA